MAGGGDCQKSAVANRANELKLYGIRRSYRTPESWWRSKKKARGMNDGLDVKPTKLK